MKALYIVLSRDVSDFIFATYDKALAEQAKQKQMDAEENGGGRPSVYIKTTTLQSK